ncbi:hypothetical protein [Sphingomonas hankookensis]|uniref:hypothetical protein n=1 Tax=Sphingomonas hankookensis TaxID=563996 RepID=UPI003D3037B3
MALPRLTAAATALALILGTIAPATAQERRADPVDLVNPLMGTDLDLRTVLWQHLSGDRPAMGHELLDADHQQGR